MNYNLTVIKLGGKDIFENDLVYDDIKQLVNNGERIIFVTGGSYAIELKHQSVNKEMVWLTLPNGDRVRFCNHDEMKIINSAYRDIVFPHVTAKLSKRGVSSIAFCGMDRRLISGKKYPPLKIRSGDKYKIEHNSLVGEILNIDSHTLEGLLNHFSVVIFAPPIASETDDNINVDADMIAAHMAIQMRAAYLHFLTSTNGILGNTQNPSSTILNITANFESKLSYVNGRMKQKLRAAIYAASNGPSFVTISSSREKQPITRMKHDKTTHIWKLDTTNEVRQLYLRMVQISSLSGHEQRISNYLVHALKNMGFRTRIDEAGNLVAKIGKGKKKLLLLGHLDTVPGTVALYTNEDCLSGRGSVDAKGPLAAFINAASHFKNSDDINITVIGTVEEESSSGKGGIYVRDKYNADAVIIGEPSNTTGIVLGYNGLVKVAITSEQANAHSASRHYISAPDIIISAINELNKFFMSNNSQSVSLREFNSWHENVQELSKAILNIRILPKYPLENLIVFFEKFRAEHPNIKLEILRMAPGILNSKTSDISKSLYRSILRHGKQPNFIFKSGTSDMNTIGAKWDCPMIAYGPGDGALDHTPNEHASLSDFDISCKILKHAIIQWAEIKHEDVI